MADHSTQSWEARVRQRLSGLNLDPATEAETIEELTQHVEDRHADLLAAGADENEAAVRAWRELEGHPRLAREISGVRRAPLAPPVQDVSRGGWPAIRDDFKFAWRRLHHSPGFAIVALLTVMLTIGANTAILSIADAVLFRPLPYWDPGHVAIIQMADRTSGTHSTGTAYAFLEAINSTCPSVSEVGLAEGGPYFGGGRGPQPTIDTADGPEAVPTVEVTSNYFGLLGVLPARGRLFTDADTGGAGRVALLSYSAWQQLAGASESAVGKSITLGPATFDVIGVLPSGFVFPSAFVGRPSIVTVRRPLGTGEKGGTFHAIVRIASGVSRDRAQAEVEAATGTVAARLGRPGLYPVLEDVRSTLYPVGRPIMRFLLAGAGLILLLGCANLANLMLLRSRRSLQETAVRLALGASRLRLVRPILFEALLLGVTGSLLAVLLTSVTFDWLLRQVPPLAYGRAEVGVDARVIAASLLMGFICGFAFSVIPAWRVSGIEVLPLIQRRGGRSGRIRLGRPLVAVQVALAVSVVFGAAIATRAFVDILRTPLGFSSDNVLQISMQAPGDAKERQAFFEQVIRVLQARPDVVVAGAAGSLPLSGAGPDEGAVMSGSERPVAGIVHALPGYFESAGIPLRRGHLFTWDDVRTNPDAAIVSESAARAMFQDAEPLGGVFSNGHDRNFTVVGVVGDVVNSLRTSREPPRVYAMPGTWRGPLFILARMTERRASSVAAIKADLRRLSGVRAPRVDWWADQIAQDNAFRDPRFQTLVLTCLAALALGLTTLGIFSVVAYLVSARTREMGVRLAIGASPESLVALMVREVSLPIVVGLVSGGVLIWWGRRLAEAQLYKVKTTDPVTLTAAAAAVVISALIAAYLPARRVIRINPTDVLRSE